jgi:hypothetical protein
VQVSDKNLYPSVYSVFYSREGERIVPNRERGYAGAGRVLREGK